MYASSSSSSSRLQSFMSWSFARCSGSAGKTADACHTPRAVIMGRRAPFVGGTQAESVLAEELPTGRSRSQASAAWQEAARTGRREQSRRTIVTQGGLASGLLFFFPQLVPPASPDDDDDDDELPSTSLSDLNLHNALTAALRHHSKVDLQHTESSTAALSPCPPPTLARLALAAAAVAAAAASSARSSLTAWTSRIRRFRLRARRSHSATSGRRSRCARTCVFCLQELSIASNEVDGVAAC